MAPSPSIGATVMPPAQGNAAGNRMTGAENSTPPRTARVTDTEASSILSHLASAARLGDRASCRKSAARIWTLSSQSEKNRLRFASAGAAYVLAASFSAFADGGAGGSLGFLSGILSSLVLVFPIEDEEAFFHMGSLKSLDAIASIIKSADPSTALNAVLVLKEIVCFDRDLARAAARIDPLIEALMSLIRDPISPRHRKASLLTAFHLVASADGVTTVNFARMGMVSLVLESLVDSVCEKRVSEAALAAFNRLCGCELGREKAYENALTVPVLVKKIFEVSNLATDFAVSSLWKLCKNWKSGKVEEGKNRECVAEAVQLGAFMKLLILLQVDCNLLMRERVTELLRFLDEHGKGLGCIDSKDFGGVRGPV